ncbi:uncharacterized protein BO97DRAFT_412548 [Aspergillus homomorphus CBS 101889]|uniref:TM7S3/TM198-like domain-containing protein n=1 Tax=Aspergillus homomorphus (strain CBS 101889) TaxID=1450537 RepID=A0A395I390_ASPHC|nr:hypothetical protein BO97DRAFT_412548 [Aspergillus homomorphus CBS 101889]RAL14205.1 hypothetical protein BO97DRAFT_412548 [Aspergillus homomorphus CBS 101889]
MRLFSLLTLAVYFVPTLFFLVSAQIPHSPREITNGLVTARDNSPPSTTTQANDGSTITGTLSHATAAAGNATKTTNATIPASTTSASLNTSVTSNDNKAPTDPNALPLQPKVTPALGIGGFILLAAGAVLALIGIQNLWIQVFLSTAFLTSLGVTVLIVYVMSPPVRVAVQGAYLVAIFLTGATFGALAIVFKELTEGLGCLLGGFCSSMWLLSLKPGGLLTDTNSKSGFIGAMSAAFYAMSFSHYTRPYGLMASTGISGGTAVALGIDCFSRAGLKEFWLYIWHLNPDIFPLGTSTYPVTRNIRVELAVTVIVAILGVISQLRLWKVVRERRRKEKEKRDQERQRREEAEAEVGRRLEEDNIQERKEWEAKYGDGSPLSSTPELAGDEKRPIDEMDAMEKGDAVEVHSISGSSYSSYRCSDCRERGGDSDTESHTSDASAGSRDGEQQGAGGDSSSRIPLKVFDGAAAARMKDDKSSDVAALVGSEAGSVRSRRLSRSSVLVKAEEQCGEIPRSESKEALASVDGTASSSNSVPDAGSDRTAESHTTPGPYEGEVKEGSKPQVKELTEAKEPASQALQEAQATDTPVDVKEGPQANGTEQLPQKGPTNEQNQEPEQKEGQAMPPAASETSDNKPQDATLEKQVEEADGEKSPASGQTEEISPEQAQVSDKPHDKQTRDEKEPNEDENSTTSKAIPENAKRKEGKKSSKKKSKTSTKLRTETTPPTENKPDQPLNNDEEGPQESSLEKPPQSTTTSDKKEQANIAIRSKSTASNRPHEIEPKPQKEEPSEPPKLNEKTVKHLPRQTSKVVQSYRTNEWAKHLADAEVPEIEPIKPVEEEEPEVVPEVNEVAAPVNVEELLLTPLNAQPPPAVERKPKDLSRSKSHRVPGDPYLRRGLHPSRSKKKASSPPTDQLQLSNPTHVPLVHAVAAEQAREEPEPPKPRWRGPPPLIAVREDMMRNRLSSFSLNFDPFSRNSSGSWQAPLDSQPPRYSFAGPAALDETDDMPLSQRRTLLHQQTVQSPPQAHIPNAVVPRRNLSNGHSPGSNIPAAMAAWRESILEDLRDKQNPLAKQDGPVIATGVDRSPPSYGQSLQRHGSLVHHSHTAAEGPPRGDMSDLHREAMRRMQAKANRKFPSCILLMVQG